MTTTELLPVQVAILNKNGNDDVTRFDVARA
jgi:hypothetical protein